MVTGRRRRGAVCAAAAFGVACQALVGIEDKQLDPSYDVDGGGAAGSAGSGPSGSDPVPPGRPPGNPTPGGGATRWFAVRTMYLGTVDPATGKSAPDAWRSIGHDIDGECTTADISKSDSSTTCRRPSNSASTSLEDGDDCRDNASGKLLAMGMQLLSSNFEAQLAADMETAESPSYMLRLDDLGDGPDDPYVRGALYITVPRDPTKTKAPKWNGEDQFIVDISTVISGDGGPAEGGLGDAGSFDANGDAPPAQSPLIEKPRFVFDQGYMTNHVWVSGDFRKSPMTLPLFVLDRIMQVTLPTVTLVAGLSPQHDRVVASQMSAVVPTKILEDDFRPVAYEIVGCFGLLGDTLMNQYILPGRDLGDAPPTFKTPQQACDAESLGFAFRWEPVKPPAWVDVGPEKPFTCADGG